MAPSNTSPTVAICPTSSNPSDSWLSLTSFLGACSRRHGNGKPLLASCIEVAFSETGVEEKGRHRRTGPSCRLRCSVLSGRALSRRPLAILADQLFDYGFGELGCRLGTIGGRVDVRCSRT